MESIETILSIRDGSIKIRDNYYNPDSVRIRHGHIVAICEELLENRKSVEVNSDDALSMDML